MYSVPPNGLNIMLYDGFLFQVKFLIINYKKMEGILAIIIICILWFFGVFSVGQVLIVLLLYGHAVSFGWKNRNNQD